MLNRHISFLKRYLKHKHKLSSTESTSLEILHVI